MLNERAHLVYVKGALWDKYCVCAPGDAGVPCDPTRVSSHDFDYEYTMVTLCRRVQPIDGFSRNGHRRVKAEGVVGGSQVVVDGLRYANDRKADHGELGRHAQCVLTPDDDKTIDTKATHGVEDSSFAVAICIWVGSAGPEDCASPRENPTDGGDIEGHRVPFHGSAPPVTKSDELVAIDLDALAYDSSDHSVQTWAIAPASQHSYTH